MKRTAIIILGILMCFASLFSMGCSEFKGDYEQTDAKTITSFAKNVAGKESINYNTGVSVEFNINGSSGESKVLKIKAVDNGRGIESSGALVVKSGSGDYTVEFWYLLNTLYTKSMYINSEPQYAMAQVPYADFLSGYVQGFNALTLNNVMNMLTHVDTGANYFIDSGTDGTKIRIDLVGINGTYTGNGSYYFVYDSFNNLKSIKVESEYLGEKLDFELTPWKGKVENPDLSKFTV